MPKDSLWPDRPSSEVGEGHSFPKLLANALGQDDVRRLAGGGCAHGTIHTAPIASVLLVTRDRQGSTELTVAWIEGKGRDLTLRINVVAED